MKNSSVIPNAPRVVSGEWSGQTMSAARLRMSRRIDMGLPRILAVTMFSLLGAALSVHAVPQASGSSRAPIAVSPGATNTITSVADRCPTFSWSASAAAESYELTVYRIGEAESEALPALSETLPGGALSWTPPLGSCLERGVRYAWSVREAGQDGSAPWSEPALFEIAKGPSTRDIEEALRVLEAYVAGAGRQAESTSSQKAEEHGRPETSPAAIRAEPGPPAGTTLLGPAAPMPGITLGLRGGARSPTVNTSESRFHVSTQDGGIAVFGKASSSSGGSLGYGVYGEGGAFSYGVAGVGKNGARGTLGGWNFGIKSEGDLLVENGVIQLTRAGDPRSLRLRTSGLALDLDFSGADLIMNGDVGAVLGLKRTGEILWRPQTSFVSLRTDAGHCYDFDPLNETTCRLAVHLPHGATITKVTWYFLDASNENGTLKLGWAALAGSSSGTMLKMHTWNGIDLTYCPGASECQTWTPTPIANDANHYRFEMTYPQDDFWSKGIRIEYTTGKPH